MSKQIFRKVALDRLSSPEQLDQVMQVTNPRGWIALSSLGLLLVAALVWGVLGELPDRVAGSGILTKSGGVLEVATATPGRITEVPVRVGELVTEGQVVAWLDQPALSAQLQAAKSKLGALRRERSQSVRFKTSDAALQSSGIEQQRANLRASITAMEQNLQGLEERIRAQEQLVTQGLITRTVLLGTRQQADQARERISATRSELAQLDVRRMGVQHERDETVRVEDRKIEEAEAAVAQLEREFRAATQVTSPYTGRVLEMMIEPGKVVGVGEQILSLDRTGRGVQSLEAVVYVPAVQGKRIRPGMKIQVAPSTVRQEEYGMMLGTVTFVSSYPATPRGMLRVLKNDQLVSALAGSGAPYEVHATLAVDPSTPSRFRWSSSKGPPTQVQSGTLAGAHVIVETQRPISKVIPLLHRWTGI
jgi:HlyD family secretion protein